MGEGNGGKERVWDFGEGPEGKKVRIGIKIEILQREREVLKSERVEWGSFTLPAFGGRSHSIRFALWTIPLCVWLSSVSQ